MNPITKLWHSVKQFIQMRFPGGRLYALASLLGGTSFDYAAHARPRSNAIVVACINWICRTFPEAPLQVLDTSNGKDVPVPGHALEQLLRRPNDFYSGTLLWMATLADWVIDGNAYWLAVRSGVRQVVQLWWVPHSLIEPKWPDDGSEFISHYEYRPRSVPLRLEVDDVIHFRHGIDPENIRLGLSPLKALVREIYTDDAASNWTAAILRNLAVPGLVISPKSENAVMGEPAKDSIRKQIAARAGNDMRGGTLILDGAVSADIVSFSPEQLQLTDIRDIPEERITAALGIPAAVVGFGSGLQQTKVGATMHELREMAYENNIIPSQRLFAEEMNTQLLPNFADPDRFTLAFDLSRVRVLQDDQSELWKRAVGAFDGALLTRNQALAMVGREAVGPTGDVYKVGMQDIFLPAGTAGGKRAPGPHGNGRFSGKDLPPPDDADRRQLERSMEDNLTEFFSGQLGRVLAEGGGD